MTVATRKGPIDVVLEGRGPLKLRDSNYIRTGGEASVYQVAGTAVKIYTDAAKMTRDGMADKVRLLAKIRHPGIVAPEGVVRMQGDSQPVGLYMPFVTGYDDLPHVFVRDHRARIGFEDANSIQLATDMWDVVEVAHANKAVMVDANEMNWLFQFSGKKASVKVIDVDSWAIGRWRASVIMPSIRDWSARELTDLTDWFSWGVVTFQIFTGIHPYKGFADGYLPRDFVKRMQDGVSVFDPRVRMPHSVRDFSCIPGPLLDWYRATFQEGKREVPPMPTYVAKPAAPALVVHAVTGPAGKLLHERVAARVNDKIVRVWPSGAALLVSGMIIDTTTGRDLVKVLSPDVEVVPVHGDAFLVAEPPVGHRRRMGMYVVDRLSPPMEVTPSLNITKFFRSGDRLFGVMDEDLVELQLLRASATKAVVTASRRMPVRPAATRWFDGVAVQDVFGASFLLLPAGLTGTVQPRVRELDGMTVIAAKAGGRFVAMTALDASGAYHKVELTFDKDFSKYVAWAGDVDSPDLNMGILDNGVVGVIARDGELALFVPTNATVAVNKIADRRVTTDMRLASIRDMLVYVDTDGALWRVRS